MIAPQGRVIELLDAFLQESVRHRRTMAALLLISYPIVVVAPVGSVLFFFGAAVSGISSNMAALGFYARWRDWDEVKVE